MAEDDKQELENNQAPEDVLDEDNAHQALDNGENDSDYTSSSEQESTDEKPIEIKSKSRAAISFESITADELLPESGDQPEETFQQKLKSLSQKSRSKIEKKKITFSKVMITLICIVGFVLIMVELNTSPEGEKKYLIYELPRMTVNVFSEIDNLPRNITVDVSIGVDENSIKTLNTDECYNIVYDVLSNMTFEQYYSVNVQYNIKNEVMKGFKEKSAEQMDVKVYVSGLDLGKFNMEGLLDDGLPSAVNYFGK